MKLNLVIYLLTLLFLSCETNWSEKIKSRLVVATEIEIEEGYFNIGIIKSPPRTWIKLVKYKTRGKSECLMYKVPHADQAGILQLSKTCSLEKSKEVLLSNIKSLSLDFKTDKESVDRGVIVMQIIQDAMTEVRIPLINYKFKTNYERFSGHLKEGRLKSIFIGKPKESKYFKDGRLCHGVNIECRDIIPNRCDKCASGFYEVVDFNCPQGGSKFCGSEKCGGKNQPACPRGYRVLGSKLKTLCFDGSPAGFCQPGLTTFCNEDKILVCL